jgi:DNA-directed RNA polymerase subunit RPC12/RpoP
MRDVYICLDCHREGPIDDAFKAADKHAAEGGLPWTAICPHCSSAVSYVGVLEENDLGRYL